MPLKLTVERSWHSRPLPQPWFSIAMGAVAALLLSIAIVSTVRDYRFEAGALRATATVLSERLGGPMSQPSAEFTDVDGHVHQVRFSVRSDPPDHHAGQEVGVLYRRDEPSDARFDTFLECRFVALLTGVMGLMFVAGTWLSWRFRRAMFPQYAKDASLSPAGGAAPPTSATTPPRTPPGRRR